MPPDRTRASCRACAPRNQDDSRPLTERTYRSSPCRTTHTVTGSRSVPSRRTDASSSSSADSIRLSSSCVHALIDRSSVLRSRNNAPLRRDPRRAALDLVEVLRSELDIGGSDILPQALELRRARDRENPRSLGEQPGKGDLSRRRLL